MKLKFKQWCSENTFREKGNYRFFLQPYGKYLGEVADTYAYCLMPKHFHLLVKVKDDVQLTKSFPKFDTLEKLVSKQFSNCFSSYTQSFNKVYQRKGILFVKNFKRKAIITERHWQDTFLYIHLKSIMHGFTKDLRDWNWSSWKAYQTLGQVSLLNRVYY